MTSNIDPADSEKPLPPDELQYRVSGVREGEATFRESGRISASEIEAALASWERPLDSFDRILDFGCGCGRITMWLEGLADGASCTEPTSTPTPSSGLWRTFRMRASNETVS